MNPAGAAAIKNIRNATGVDVYNLASLFIACKKTPALEEIMTENHPSYIKLQRHLDNQAVGFPATKSGAEIRILQHIFSPDEAELVTCLTYQPEPVETIFQRAKHLVDSPATKFFLSLDLSERP